VLLSNGDGTFKVPKRFELAAPAHAVSVADVNGDSFPDIVTTLSLYDVSLLLGNGDGTFQVEQRFAVGGFVGSLFVADMNGDTEPDIVTVNGYLRNTYPSFISILLHK
jgi:hypothetical protein